MRSRTSWRQALFLGALHGPAELLPISSSAHLSALPWLLGSDDQEPDPELRKSFAVALHAGAAAAWLIAPGTRKELSGLPHRRPWFLLWALMPAAAAGLALEDRIQRQLDSPPSLAAGLAAGALAMAMADRRIQSRKSEQATALDGLWLGIAQACALLPGVSRSGATLTAARMRGFRRGDARRLSAEVGLPVIVGASSLKMLRMLRRPPAPGEGAVLLSGVAASFGSTLLVSPFLFRRGEGEALLPYALYRIALALLIIRRGSRARRLRSARP